LGFVVWSSSSSILELLKQNKQLKKDLKLSQMEVEILKKAKAFFSSQNT
jgi:transposase-like protein